ncbi:MAG: hypothetical protein C0404_02410 [Verrucomicrobia bacterium]|nr:hypothetical protein [Verrucomicrobiota bacterium]
MRIGVLISILFCVIISGCKNLQISGGMRLNEPALNAAARPEDYDYLASLQEPVDLGLETRSGDKEVYRLFVSPAFAQPRCVRIEKTRTEITVCFKETDGQRGLFPGRLVINTKRRLTMDEWATFHRLISCDDLWAPIDADIDRVIDTFDGTPVVFVSAKWGKCQSVFRNTPETGPLHNLWAFMEALFDWKAERQKPYYLECVQENRLFIEAAGRGDLQEVKRLHAKGVHVDTQVWETGETAIHEATKGGHFEVVDYLLDNGSKAITITALRDAIQYGNRRIVDLLLKRDTLKTARDLGDCIVSAASQGDPEIAKMLIAREAGILTNKWGASGITIGQRSLDEAAENGQLAMVEFILTQGGDINSTNGVWNRSPLMSAAFGPYALRVHRYMESLLPRAGQPATRLRQYSPPDNLAVMKFLLSKGASSDFRDEFGGRLIHVAAEGGDPNIVSFVLSIMKEVNEARTQDGFTPLHIAAFRGNSEAVEVLAANGADLNVRCAAGSPPYIQALYMDHHKCADVLIAKGCRRDHALELCFAARHGDIEGVRECLRMGADINALVGTSQDFRETPLLAAVSSSATNFRNEIIGALLKQGADVNKADDKGRTPLFCAVENQKISNQVLDLIMGAGAELNKTNCNGRTALMVALLSGNISAARHLVERGANVNTKDAKGMTTLMLAVTGDHIAADGPDPEIMRLLIKMGVDVKAKDNEGLTALLLCAKNYNRDTVEPLRVLIEAGADPNDRTPDGYDALSFTIQGGLNGRRERSKFLIEKGCDVNVRVPISLNEKKEEPTLLRFARNTDQYDVVNLLKKAGAKD